MGRTITERITEFCQGLDYDEIPLRVLNKTKDLVLDTLGICMVSSRLDFGQGILSLVQSWGGVPESSLVGSEAKLPAQNAAFANGVLVFRFTDNAQVSTRLKPYCGLQTRHNKPYR